MTGSSRSTAERRHNGSADQKRIQSSKTSELSLPAKSHIPIIKEKKRKEKEHPRIIAKKKHIGLRVALTNNEMISSIAYAVNRTVGTLLSIQMPCAVSRNTNQLL